MRYCRNLNQKLTDLPIQSNSLPLINANSPIFTIGSCFAMEIREYLKRMRYCVEPQYENLEPKISTLRKVDHSIAGGKEPLAHQLLWYNTFTIRQEFEKLAGEFIQHENDYWRETHSGSGYQDPYRRLVFADSLEHIRGITGLLDNAVSHAIRNAAVIIITLGLTEVWFKKDNGRAICAAPNYAGSYGIGRAKFRMTEYSENYQNMCAVVEIARQYNPDVNILVTVSPVPLQKTAHLYDQLIANTESKSILRAVAGALSRQYDKVYYFPSYEWAMNMPREKVFRDDGIHVRKEFVTTMMQNFEQHYIDRLKTA